MIGALAWIMVAGLAVLGAIVVERWVRAQVWRGSLVVLRARFPRGLTPDEVSAWLAVVGTLGEPVGWEVVARAGEISHYLLVPETLRAELVARTSATLPRLRLEETTDYRPEHVSLQVAAELRITNLSWPLASDRAATTNAALLGALQVPPGVVVRLQWIVSGLPTPRPRSTSDPARDLAGAERHKHGQPLLGLVGRVGIGGATGQGVALLRRITGIWRLLDAPSVRIVRRLLPSELIVRRMLTVARPLTVWPVVVNVQEATGLLGVPLGNVSVPGLPLGRARHLPPPPGMARTGTVLAESSYPGLQGRPLVIAPRDRLRHLWLNGPTGVGKSELLSQITIGDIASGFGLVQIDPKGDLTNSALEHAPEEALDRIVVVDPSKIDGSIVGFNPLAVPSDDEQARELAADQVLHIFRDLYRSFWGPRTDEIVRAGLLTLVSVPAPDGSAFTLCELPELLVNAGLRAYVRRRSELPEVLRTYWTWFDTLSEGERQQMVAAPSNKLRALTMRTPVRLMLGQSRGLDLGEVMRRRQVLLVSLANGKLGPETSAVVGSLLLGAVWQAALGRVNLPPEQRLPFYLLVDEFQDFVRQGESLVELLSQARAMGVGAVLANQYLAQLPEAVRTAVLGTVRSQVVFQVEHDDARLLERRFAPALSADDLMGLGAYEIALRACVDGQTTAPATGRTLPLGPPLREAAVLAEASRQRFGMPRVEVEAGLRARTLVGSDLDSFGRILRMDAS